MTSSFMKPWISVFAIVAVSVTAGLANTARAANSGDNTITFGWTAWSDAEFVTKLAKQVIEQKSDYTVDLKMSAIGVQYQGVANGDLDGMLMAWLPDTHADYWAKFKDQVVDLGPLYKGAKLGWVVPDYVPKSQLDSISDLTKSKNASELGGTIQGIDPGAGLMQLSDKTMSAYGLEDDYRLISSSGAAMTAALARAEKKKQWIVVTGWTPHWMFGRWKLRFLEDPKGTLGQAQHIDAVVREGFKKDYPQVAAFLSNMNIPLKQLQAAMYQAQEGSYDGAIKKYIASHQDEVNSWWPKSMAAN